MSDGYHHGDLRRTLLTTAATVIAESGPASLSLRDLARRAGVSHAAPAHHFRDRRGLLTALAAEGQRLLADALAAAAPAGFDEAAVAYVRFARTHPGHYAVMHRPDLVAPDAPELVAARAAASEQLAAGVASLPVEARAGLADDDARRAAWALVHGIATLAAEDATPEADLEAFTRRAARQLFG